MRGSCVVVEALSVVVMEVVVEALKEQERSW